MKGIELRYDGNGNVLEPAVRNGMMAVGDTLRQNQALLLTLHKGELKEQLEMDGQTVAKVRITEKGVEIEASY